MKPNSMLFKYARGDHHVARVLRQDLSMTPNVSAEPRYGPEYSTIPLHSRSRTNYMPHTSSKGLQGVQFCHITSR